MPKIRASRRTALGTAFGLVAPSGTPPGIIGRIAEAVNAALRDPEVGGRPAELGAALGGSTPEQFAALVEREGSLLGSVIREANIRAE